MPLQQDICCTIFRCCPTLKTKKEIKDFASFVQWQRGPYFTALGLPPSKIYLSPETPRALQGLLSSLKEWIPTKCKPKTLSSLLDQEDRCHNLKVDSTFDALKHWETPVYLVLS